MNTLEKHIDLDLYGLVQGVGFRPFLHKLAEKLNIKGYVRNTSGGLSASVEGEETALLEFIRCVGLSPPELSSVIRSEWRYSEFQGYMDFKIVPSVRINKYEYTFAGADTAPCGECLKELNDPSDRRYRYPFINCTDCGPRYSIINRLPYDRSSTVMDEFEMCAECGVEYNDISDRRYHAQPNCCAKCGPGVFFAYGKNNVPDGDPFLNAVRLLCEGGILAVKGTGGIHLACDARNIKAVQALRERKNRPARPLAVMASGIEAVRQICDVSDEEAKLLCSVSRPIVLLRKKQGIDPLLSFGKRLGVMLPYTPLHYILMGRQFYPGYFSKNEYFPDLLVMTSANEKGCPVLTKNSEAFETLDGIADGFLLHNRRIANRIDDSVAVSIKADESSEGRIYFFRRSRGYAPLPIKTDRDVSGILALGAEQKASFALGRDRCAFLSPHIGDLKNAETYDHYTEASDTYERLFNIIPSCIACDLHPDYFSTRYAYELSSKYQAPVIQIQHHWAHMASCMADNSLDTPVFGIIWDGTGLGEDGEIWGGEFLKGDFCSYKRLGSIRPIRLPGGDLAVRDIKRTAVSLALDSGSDINDLPLADSLTDGGSCAIEKILTGNINSPASSGIGRLFDGIYSLLTGCASVSFDGEAAQRLEALASSEIPDETDLYAGSPRPLTFYNEKGVRKFDTRPIVKSVIDELRQGRNISAIAEGFMLTLCHMALDQALNLNPEKLPVVLSGGVFLNMYMLNGIYRLLTKAGYKVYIHERVSCCDEGLSLGQLMICASQTENK